jgi:alkylated DNA repair dioxygenase AlkB
VLPPDFRWIPGWLDAAAASALEVEALGAAWEDPLVRIGGRAIPMPRRVAFYGPHAYAYSGVRHVARPLPDWLDEIRRRVEDTAAHPFNTVLLNLYRSGADSVSWHSDDDYPHGGHPAVASLSLGAARPFRIAHRRIQDERYRLELTAGGLLIMAGRSQEDYRHALPKCAGAARRVNLTFRFMAAPNHR